MANQEHLDLLKQGSEVWNAWREQNPAIRPDLSGVKLIFADLSFSYANLSEADLSRAILSYANLSYANLSYANLSRANLSGANLSGAILSYANLSGAHFWGANLISANLIRAHLSGAHLNGAHLSGADLNGANLNGANLDGAHLSRAHLSGADLSRANLSRADLSFANLDGAYLSRVDLSRANLSRADLRGAHLSGANLSRVDLSRANLSGAILWRANLSGTKLSGAMLIKTNLIKATLADCRIYGILVKNVQLEGATQTNLNISDDGEPTITVDNLEVAQFLYLLLNNTKIRDVIDTIAKKAVLILGRFTSERKAILDALREELRRQSYLPILFDFEKPTSRNYTETISTLAHLARFIIADLTEPSSIPQELQAIVPTLAVPVQPILLEGKREYAMFVDFLKTYEWVLPIHYYTDENTLLASLQDKIIKPAEDKAKALEQKRN